VEAMSNLRPKTTGIDGVVIWISAGEFAGVGAQHGPRIKVVVGEKITAEGLKESVSVTITKPPRVLGTLPGKVSTKVVRFVERNHDALIQHWNGELDAKEVLDLLRRV